MKLRRDSFLYKFTYSIYGEETGPLGRVNFCDFAKDFGLSLFFYFALFFCYTVGFFFSYRPATKKEEIYGTIFVRYQRWPTIKGHRIWPITVILVMLGTYLCYKVAGHFYLLGLKTAILQLVASAIFWAILLIPAVLIILVVWVAKKFNKFRKTETYEQLKAWLTGKFCPTIEIIE